ncbi:MULTISPECIES: hypothetical protein [Actinomyces]|uniref:Lipoprotein n=1 Tax=Actinomyces respiraculi TaxID=2744574 RepID=A0A7T0PXF9_9ACTO|nr:MULTISPECIES: hypothetical protein [Actinomyces]QPL05590.1 hypothetical protein ID810_00915 [Actinomyces respiraculi]
MKTSLNTRIITRAAALLTCTACAVGLMTGCSGSKTEETAQASASAASADDYLLRMAQCLRDKGIDVSDPDADGNMKFPENDAAYAAVKECEDVVGPAPGAEDLSDPSTQQDMVKAAQCLRDAGYDVPDPEVGKGLQLNEEIPQDVMNRCFSDLGDK